MTRARLTAALAAIVLLVLIAALASAGGHTTHADPATARIDACARTATPDFFARLPAGMHAVALDDLITGVIEDQANIPPEMQKWLQMREIDSGGERVGIIAVIPAGNQRAELLNEFVARSMQNGSPPPQQVGGATLVHLSTAYGEISAALTFSGCRAVLIATRNDATTLSAVARQRGK